MTQSIKPLIAGNWKMNGTVASLKEVAALKESLGGRPRHQCDMVICPPATLIQPMAHAAVGSGIRIGGQDCHANNSGAHTGDLSAPMLAEAGAEYVIVGHSERRADHAETDQGVRAKAEAVIAAGLIPIICVGESEAQRRDGTAIAVVEKQLSGSVPDGADDAEMVIAYEPVWAIGTGLTPTNADIEEMHNRIRTELVARFGERGAGMRILYGGSMKPGNAAEILGVSNVNGGLIGGASLKAVDFLAIIDAA